MTDLTPPATGECSSFSALSHGESRLSVKAHDWENKAARPANAEIGDAYDALLHGFEAFKETND